MPSRYSALERLRAASTRLRRELYALALACRDPRVPWYTKAIAIVVIAYALSPIDLVPDFVPVLGYLDDLIIVPLGIALLLRAMPADVMAECRARAAAEPLPAPSRLGAAIVIAAWIGAALLVWYAVS